MRFFSFIILSVALCSVSADRTVWGYEGQNPTKEKQQIVDESTSSVEYLETKPRFKEQKAEHPQHQPNFKQFRSVEFVKEGVIDQMHDDMHQDLKQMDEEDMFADAELVSNLGHHSAFEQNFGGVSFIETHAATMAPPRKHFSADSIFNDFDHKINQKMSADVSVSTVGALHPFSLLETGSKQIPSFPLPSINFNTNGFAGSFLSTPGLPQAAVPGPPRKSPEPPVDFASVFSKTTQTTKTQTKTAALLPPEMPNLPPPPYIEPVY